MCIKVDLNPRYSNPQFQKKPNAAEMKKYTNSITQGLRLLNKETGMIVHNSSAPSKSGQNLGIGSLLSVATTTLLMPFLAEHGFSKVQQEPDNIRGPYNLNTKIITAQIKPNI